MCVPSCVSGAPGHSSLGSPCARWGWQQAWQVTQGGCPGRSGQPRGGDLARSCCAQRVLPAPHPSDTGSAAHQLPARHCEGLPESRLPYKPCFTALLLEGKEDSALKG